MQKGIPIYSFGKKEMGMEGGTKSHSWDVLILQSGTTGAI